MKMKENPLQRLHPTYIARLTRQILLLAVMAIAMLLHSAAKADSFRFVTTPFVPFTNPDADKDGFLGEIAHEVMERQGHQLEIVYRPWARALAEAEKADFDGLLSAFYNEERGKVFYFSAPLNSTHMVLAGMSGRFGAQPRYKSLTDFKGMDIAVGRKWAYSEAFDNYDGFRRVLVGNEAAGIRMLFADRVDLLAVNVDQFRSVIRTMPGHNSDMVTILTPAISSNDQHLAVSRQAANGLQLLADFNTGLAALKASGRYTAIRNNHF